jgi:hypothetical protein
VGTVPSFIINQHVRHVNAEISALDNAQQ